MNNKTKVEKVMVGTRLIGWRGDEGEIVLVMIGEKVDIWGRGVVYVVKCAYDAPENVVKSSKGLFRVCNL